MASNTTYTTSRDFTRRTHGTPMKLNEIEEISIWFYDHFDILNSELELGNTWTQEIPVYINVDRTIRYAYMDLQQLFELGLYCEEYDEDMNIESFNFHNDLDQEHSPDIPGVEVENFYIF